MQNLSEIIEGILLVSGEGVSFDDISTKLGCTQFELREAINELKAKFGGSCGIHLLEFENKYQLCSNPKYSEKIQQVLNPIKEKELTQTLIEVAAIIAYKQPITKVQIEEIRGVSCDYAISTLLKQDIIRVSGKSNSVGKAYLFKTSENFLKKFNLKSIEQLPSYEDIISKLKGESVLKEDILKEISL